MNKVILLAATCLLFLFGCKEEESTQTPDQNDNAATYAVGANTNCIVSDFAKAVTVSVNGTYTIKLIESTFRENANNPNPQAHIIAQTNSNWGDYQTFTLNGIGDSKTLSGGDATLRLFYIDNQISDNTGYSKIELSQKGGNTTVYTVNANTNCIVSDFAKAVTVSVNGTYTIKLIESTFRENANNPNPQAHIIAQTNSNWGDYQTFTLNGIGDSKTLSGGDATLRLFFIDNQISDNTGYSKIEVKKQ